MSNRKENVDRTVVVIVAATVGCFILTVCCMVGVICIAFKKNRQKNHILPREDSVHQSPTINPMRSLTQDKEGKEDSEDSNSRNTFNKTQSLPAYHFEMVTHITAKPRVEI